MPKLLLPLIAALAVGGSAAGAGVYLATRDAGVEETTRPPSALDTPEPSPTATVVESPTADVTPTAAAADWAAYSDPGGKFTVRYPRTWFESDGSLYSRDPGTFKGGPELPAEVVKVEAGYYEAVGSTACGGALDVDPKTGQATPTVKATAANLGGMPAWQIVRKGADPALEGGLTRIHGISLVYKGFCLKITAYYTQQDPDVEAFLEIASTFKFEF